MSEPSRYLIELLREGPDFTLYRGRQRDNPSPILVVALTAEQPSPQGLRRLEHEYSLAADLESAGAVKPLTLTRHEGRTILVLKDPGGEPLDLVLERNQGQLLDLTRFLHIAIGLAKAIGQIHQRGLIHKDIKPAIIFVDDVANVWLTGFGIASRMPRERQSPAPIETISGTLAYMAPEQTGRMNRSIDTRSDLYSLGITLYQMLTGTLPFDAADPLEWVHCHIARRPPPPGERIAVPEPLSAITMKLLTKNAEERYQTAAGLEFDLRRCLAEWQTHGRIDPFPLGARDIPGHLPIPEKLYGRDGEIATLLDAFEKVVAHGTSEFVLVAGYSGVGKSSLVSELHQALITPRGLFASGKFDQYKRDIPYATLAHAFQTLVHQILVKSEAEVRHWRHALQEALCPNGQLIINLIPEVELLIGKQPPVPDLPPQDARNRFQLVFRAFLGTFTRPEHPLALFLDDLQWLDAATLELIEQLMTDPDVRHLMLIGAYRDNEVSSTHPLARSIETIRRAGANIEEIILAPLRLDDLTQLVCEALHADWDSARPLARLVHEKTDGNPFFAIQFLAALADEGLLALDKETAIWIWDVARIRAKGYTENAVDLMVSKLKRLPETAQLAIQQLACLGNVVEISTLSMVFEKSEEEIRTLLLDAARAGLIQQVEGAYAFLHDRIQEAAYSLLSDEDRADTHLRIGRALLSRAPADKLGEHLFDLANQFNQSAGRLIDRDEKVQVATIDLRAGKKAKAATAYASACVYLAAGMALLDEAFWIGHYELMFNLRLERAECAFLTGQFDIAKRLLAELLQRATLKVDLAAAYILHIKLHILNLENEEAVASALTCLRLLDIDLPAHPSSELVQAEYETIWQTLDGHPIESLLDTPLMTNPDLQAAIQVLMAVAPAAWCTDYRLFCLTACRAANIAMLHGLSEHSPLGFAFLGIILGPIFRRYKEGYRLAKLACDLVERRGFKSRQAAVYLEMALASIWTQPISTAIDFLLASFRVANETGDLTYACFTMDQRITIYLLRNDPLDAVWHEAENGLHFARKARFQEVAVVIESQRWFIATMQGRTATFSAFGDAPFDQAAFEAQITGDGAPAAICQYWILKVKACFLSGDCAEALSAANKAKALLWAMHIHRLDYYLYFSLTIAALYEKTSAEEQQAWRDLLAAYREQLREWAENYPPTFADKHALVSAEIARLEKRDADAPQLYEKAIHLARKYGFVQNEGLAEELAAQYHLARGLETAGYAHLRNARNCYDRWGAHAKVRQLDEHYPRLRQEATPTFSATIGQPAARLDVATVVKASQALSSEMVLNKLIEKLLRLALEHVGAERGLLIFLRGDEPQIEAEATTADGRVEVAVRQKAVMPSDLPQSALHYVIRTREAVVLDDASAENLHSDDEYVRQKRPRSVLCLPIVKQSKLIGALYFENNLTPSAFTSDRITVLELLAAQAAISLENASLYSDLQGSEEKIRQSERELRQIVDFAPQQVAVLGPDRSRLYANEAILEYFGCTLEEWRRCAPSKFVHPDDMELLYGTESKFSKGVPHEAEVRLLSKGGKYRSFLIRWNPLRDDRGWIVRWYVAATDIEDRKQAEQRLQNENVALREEIDKVSMFEEIVGISPALHAVLSRVSKVAPTDSTVLITGETGTGKELIARAVHKRSRRSSRPFVSVNCAVIPRDLIASELFGHEKGAFTGATQRRIGRFELAEGGTIFLDEIGELPPETQIALLRVLQEHEFERVGGTGTIRTNVRVIAATNRDLESAIASGMFRNDLFYRLNVFPIEVPPLRERREDISVLVEYFIDRYARKAGRSFHAVNKKSLDLLQSYPWPGNIRELQNVIERSVIVCDTENFSVDESWLSRQPVATAPRTQVDLSEKLAAEEKEIIESALRESRGRVSGPSGAAAKLGLRGTTLESKIKSLKINKHNFRGV